MFDDIEIETLECFGFRQTNDISKFDFLEYAYKMADWSIYHFESYETEIGRRYDGVIVLVDTYFEDYSTTEYVQRVDETLLDFLNRMFK